jgi:hypothetical protein
MEVADHFNPQRRPHACHVNKEEGWTTSAAYLIIDQLEESGTRFNCGRHEAPESVLCTDIGKHQGYPHTPQYISPKIVRLSCSPRRHSSAATISCMITTLKSYICETTDHRFWSLITRHLHVWPLGKHANMTLKAPYKLVKNRIHSRMGS